MSLSHLEEPFEVSIRLILLRGAGLALEDALRRADHVVTVVLFFSEIRFLRASCFCFWLGLGLMRTNYSSTFTY